MNDDRHSSNPDFDVAKMLAPVIEFGAAVVRMQERMFATLLGTVSGSPNSGDQGGQDGQDISSHDTGDERDATAMDGDPAEAAGADLHEAIAVRADQISRSNPGGDPVQNWLQAEQQVLAERE